MAADGGWWTALADGCSTEDRPVSPLIQHLEATEIGMLSSCLCVPLVSIHARKADKHGKLFCSTGNRNQVIFQAMSINTSHFGLKWLQLYGALIRDFVHLFNIPA
ncbi:uncharacterized protein LOC144701508 isoform X1 [Wolffia australiana]